MIDWSVFRRQLRYWSIHVTLCAVPSFGLALMAFNSPAAILGMLAAIATFIAGYTFVSSLTVYQQVAQKTLLGRAVKVGTRIRVVLSLVSGFLFLGMLGGAYMLVLFAPDYWAGALAIRAVDIGGAYLGFGSPGNLMEGSSNFLPTYAIAVTEGLILSFTLVLLSFLSLVIMTLRQNRRVWVDPSGRPVGVEPPLPPDLPGRPDG